MRNIVALVLPGLLALALPGCSDDSTTPVKNDTKVRADRGTVADIGVPPDGSSLPDVGVRPDHGRLPDSGKKPDAGVDGRRPDGPKSDTLKVDGLVLPPDLRPDGLPPLPSNAVCASPALLTLGVATTGDTSPSINQYPGVDCGNYAGPWTGPQLYYKVTLAAGTDYKAVVTANFDAALYTFPAATACDETAINTACTSPSPADPKNVYNSDGLGTEIVRMSPATGGDWIIVVDSWTSTATGTFSLTVSEVVTPPNQTCGHARSLSWPTTPPLEIKTTGDTSDAVNELAAVDCGNFFGPWTEGQLYYRVALSAGKRYHATVNGGFDAAIYAFPAGTTCDATSINAACTNPTGDAYNILNADDTTTGPESVWIAPAAAGDWIIVVDGVESGPFDLTIGEYTPPTNGACLTPATVGLSASPVTIEGDSSTPPTANEFGTSITCGSSGYDYDGKQVYYKVTLQAGTAYTFEVTPTGWDAAIYAFTDATCNPTTINTQCAAAFKDDGGTGDPETLVITPSTTGDYIITIDDYLSDAGGPFSLKISW